MGIAPNAFRLSFSPTPPATTAVSVAFPFSFLDAFVRPETLSFYSSAGGAPLRHSCRLIRSPREHNAGHGRAREARPAPRLPHHRRARPRQPELLQRKLRSISPKWLFPSPRGKMDLPMGVVCFQTTKERNDMLNSWATNLEKLLDLVEESCHQIHKQTIVHKAALRA